MTQNNHNEQEQKSGLNGWLPFVLVFGGILVALILAKIVIGLIN